MDVVYIVRDGDDNQMLRYSLRSLANLPHSDVWIVGHKPSWVTGVEHVPGNRCAHKPQNVFDNVRIACSIDDLGDEIVIMNDDFFIMEPTDITLWWRRPLTDHVDSIGGWSEWKQSLLVTQEWMRRQGVHDPLSYELHVPLLTQRRVMAEVLAEASGFSPLYPPQWRTLYGNRVGGGMKRRDVKVKGNAGWDRRAPLLSCYESAWSCEFGGHVRAAFPDPSPYEGDQP